MTLFFQVATDTVGEDLSGVTVRGAEVKSVADIAREMGGKVSAVKERRDTSFARMKRLMAAAPGWLAGCLLDAAAFLQFSLNIWAPLLGAPKDPLGSVMITNVGTLGLGCCADTENRRNV